MDPENGCGDQNEEDGNGPRVPRSVREGLGVEKGKKGRRSGRKGRRGRSGQAGQEAPAPVGASQPGPFPALTNRIHTMERVFDAEGKRWTARVIGSSAVPGRSDASTRLLELAFAEADEGSPQVGTAYLAAPDLAEASDEALVSLLGRSRRNATREKRTPRKGGGGRGRRSNRPARKSGPPR